MWLKIKEWRKFLLRHNRCIMIYRCLRKYRDLNFHDFPDKDCAQKRVQSLSWRIYFIFFYLIQTDNESNSIIKYQFLAIVLKLFSIRIWLQFQMMSLWSFLTYCYQGCPKRTEHGNRPIFSTEFGNIVHILADFGNRNTGGHGKIIFTDI